MRSEQGLLLVSAPAELGQQQVNKKVLERPIRRKAIAYNHPAWPVHANARKPGGIHF